MSEKEGAYVSSISISKYSYSNPSGSITIMHGGDGGSTHLILNKEDVEAFWKLAIDIFHKRKPAIVQAVGDIKFAPLLGYNEEKTVDADVTPVPDDI